MWGREERTHLWEHYNGGHLLVKHHPPEICYCVFCRVLSHNKWLGQVIPLQKSNNKLLFLNIFLSKLDMTVHFQGNMYHRKLIMVSLHKIIQIPHENVPFGIATHSNKWCIDVRRWRSSREWCQNYSVGIIWQNKVVAIFWLVFFTCGNCKWLSVFHNFT